MNGKPPAESVGDLPSDGRGLLDPHSATGSATPGRHAEPRRRTRRRASTPPPAGSDPAPLPEPPRHRLDENDDRLTADKPPHY